MRSFSNAYLKLLKGELAGLNLTRILDEEEFYQKQIADSLIPYEQSKFFKEALAKVKVLIDVGFGGGFPLVPLAWQEPSYSFIGFEARRKKADAVALICQRLELPNVRPMHQRLEEVLIDRDCVITFKAVGKIKDMLSLVNIPRGTEVTVFFYKGPQFDQLEDITKIDGWKMISDEFFDVPGTEKRRLIGFKNVPRGTNISNLSKKNLVNASDFL
jgi:16S rRNA (guanine527-N7)-methyltransferase